MALTFEQADTLGSGWTMKVRQGPMTVGRISRGPDQRYRFSKGGGGRRHWPAAKAVVRDAGNAPEWRGPDGSTE